MASRSRSISNRGSTKTIARISFRVSFTLGNSVVEEASSSITSSSITSSSKSSNSKSSNSKTSGSISNSSNCRPSSNCRSSSNNTSSSNTNDIGSDRSSMCSDSGLSADFFNNILTFFNSGGVNHSVSLGSALLFRGAYLFINTLLGLSALLLLGAFLTLCALLFSGALLNLGTLLLWDLINNIVALRFSCRGAYFLSNWSWDSLALFYRPTGALLFMSGLNIGDSSGVADWLRDCCALLSDNLVICGLALRGNSHSWCYSNSRSN